MAAVGRSAGDGSRPPDRSVCIKTQYFCQVEGHGGCCEEGNQQMTNVPSVLAVFEEGQEGSKVDKKGTKTVRFARSEQQGDSLSRWICEMSVAL